MKKYVFTLFVLLLSVSVCFAGSNKRKWLTMANKYYDQGKYEQALKAYSKVMDYDKDNYYAWLYSGYSYLELQDMANALLYLEKAYSIKPSEKLKEKLEDLRAKPLEDVEKKENAPLSRYAIKFGINFSNITRRESDDAFGIKSGFVCGVSTLYGYGGLFSVQAEMLYSQKGGATKEFGTVFAYDYLEFPAVIKMSFYPLRDIMVSPYAGPQLGFKIASSRDGEGLDGISFVDYGMVFGGDISYPVGFGLVMADIRATLGFNDINEDENSTDNNFTLSFMAGYVF